MKIPTGEFVFFVLVLAYGWHILEEFNYNWKDWAGQTFGFDTNWAHFYVVNSFVIIFGFSAGIIGWKLPDVSLMFPAFALTNAIFFHILPLIMSRRFSPGLFTGVVLFIPVSLWIYWSAYIDGVLTIQGTVISLIGGASIMASLPLLIKTRNLKLLDPLKNQVFSRLSD
jgi:hypothetical protein